MDERYAAMIPSPHPPANCGPLLLPLSPGESCPTCGTVPTPAPSPLERLEQALAELGQLTPDGIADRMRALGIKGKRRIYCDCPVARFLAGRGMVRPGVSPAGKLDGSWTVFTDGTLMTRAPEPVAEFASRFDDGVYLDLVEVPGGATDG